MPLIYFTRHGRCERIGDEVVVSESGKKELELIAEHLRKFNFNPQVSISSPIKRAVETAKMLAPGKTIILIDELKTPGDFKRCCHLADEILRKIIKITNNHDADTIVACHDSLSAALALKLMKTRGGNIKWPTELGVNLAYLQQGYGILSQEKECWLLRPYAEPKALKIEFT